LKLVNFVGVSIVSITLPIIVNYHTSKCNGRDGRCYPPPI